jgi:hypothetical protein
MACVQAWRAWAAEHWDDETVAVPLPSFVMDALYNNEDDVDAEVHL